MPDLVPPTGAIAVMSSGQGSVANNENGGAPGWVRTDLGGPDARLGVEDSIPNLVRVIEAETGKPGLQYLDCLGRTVPW